MTEFIAARSDNTLNPWSTPSMSLLRLFKGAGGGSNGLAKTWMDTVKAGKLRFMLPAFDHPKFGAMLPLVAGGLCLSQLPEDGQLDTKSAADKQEGQVCRYMRKA